MQAKHYFYFLLHLMQMLWWVFVRRGTHIGIIGITRLIHSIKFYFEQLVYMCICIETESVYN